MGIEYIEVSAKTGHNIEKMFLMLAVQIQARLAPVSFEPKVRTSHRAGTELDWGRRQSSWAVPFLSASRRQNTIAELVTEPVHSASRLEMSTPAYVSSAYEDLSCATVCCTIKWALLRATGDTNIYNVQVGAVGLLGHFWLDVGAVDENQITIGCLQYDGEVKLRVRAAECSASAVPGTNIELTREGSWGPWSSVLVLSLKGRKHNAFAQSTAGGALGYRPARADESSKGVFEAADWKPHWTPAYLCDVCEKCHTVFSLTTRKHHCRQCGKCLCAICCPAALQVYVQMYGRKVRICGACDTTRSLQSMMRRARLSPPEPDFTSLGLAYLSSFEGLRVIKESGGLFWTQGATAVIYKGTYHDIPVAIKLYKNAFLSVQTDAEFTPARTLLTQTSATPDQLQMEEHVYRLTNKCPYAVNMIFSSTARTVKHPFIATELIDEHGTLLTVLENRSIELSWTWRLTALLQIAEFLQFLHAQNIAHLDLKAENCVVTSVDQSIISAKDCIVKVFDFNSSTTFGIRTFAEIDKLGRTPSHTPPEFARSLLVQQQGSAFPLGGSFDVFSFGILMAEVATRGLMYQSDNSVRTVVLMEEEMARGMRPLLLTAPVLGSSVITWINGTTEIPSPTFPKGYDDLAYECWNLKASLRPTAAQVVSTLKEILAEHTAQVAQIEIATKVPLEALDEDQAVVCTPALVLTEQVSPLYIVVLKQKAFQKPLLPGRLSVAETLQRQIPGLCAFVAGTSDLKRYTFLDPSGDYQLKTVYKRHAKDAKKYVLPSQYAEHLLAEKEKEFIMLMQGLGAKEIRLRGREAKREEVKAKASFSAAVFGEVGVKGAHSENKMRERDCSCQFDKPFRARPMVDKKEHYLFYDDWAGIVNARTKENSALLSQTATLSFSCENTMSAKLSAKIHELGLSVGGSTLAANHFSDSYEILFYSREEYSVCNRSNISLWSTTKVKRFLEYLDLHEYILLFAQKSIRGMDLLSENLHSNLVSLQVSDIHAERLVEAVQLQISGDSDFQCD